MKSIFKRTGILGINARNFLYIRPYNPKKAIRLADDKLKTKHFLSARGVPVPKLYGVIKSYEELEKFDFNILPSSFVLKPNFGYGGEGIVPIIDQEEEFFVKSSGELISKVELEEVISDTLEGRFSISGASDFAFFEQLIVCDDRLGKFAYKGLPDIRIVVHNLIPVMAMLRLPTRQSDGKANLHLGAVGVGIDIARGTATHVVHHNKIVDEIPEIGPIRGLKIPYWDDILLMASRAQLATNLGYLAADIAIDNNSGPVLLEINARAGLNVQIANLAPLRRRLERIQGLKVISPEKGIRIAQDMFGNKLEKEVKKISGKVVIGSREKVKIITRNDTHHVWASINPLLERSLLDRELAENLGLSEEEGTESVKMKFVLAENRIQTLARLDDLSGKTFKMVIGRRDLQDFLIDPSKGKNIPLPQAQTSFPLVDLDKELVSIDRQIKLLHHLKPLNLKEEREKFLEKPDYEPQFEYPEFLFDPFHLKEKLKRLEEHLDDSPMGELMRGKKDEILGKINLLEAIGAEGFEKASIELYGAPEPALLEAAQRRLDRMPKEFPKNNVMVSTEEAIAHFQEVLKDYGLYEWKVKVKRDMVADCLAGKHRSLFVRQGAKFDSDRLRMLVAHEIETHILTAENGKRQPYELFNRGMGYYLETQEGLAIWNQEFVISHDVSKNYRAALLVFVIHFARRHGFAATVKYCQDLGMDLERSFQTALRVKRGLEDTGLKGAFTKERVYFSGYLQIQNFVNEGGDLKDLYIGKFNLKDLQKVKSLTHLEKPFYLPKFFS